MKIDDLIARILFRDQLIIVLDKPPGIPVHAGPSGGENLEGYFYTLKFDYKETPKLAHRLDRDTSGCLVLGRNDRALRKLGKLFETGRINKTYRAIAQGIVTQDSGTIDVPLKKVKLNKGWSMQPAKKGEEGAQEAITDFKVLQRMGDRTLLELSPRTGRTHQIRVHLQSMGHPIVGDWLYGKNAERPETFERLFLHAYAIEIPLYDGKDPIRVECPSLDVCES
jgi:tRNA pseudouridine32 synthase/23S rRNA pseudouridine746 synthase